MRRFPVMQSTIINKLCDSLHLTVLSVYFIGSLYHGFIQYRIIPANRTALLQQLIQASCRLLLCPLQLFQRMKCPLLSGKLREQIVQFSGYLGNEL